MAISIASIMGVDRTCAKFEAEGTKGGTSASGKAGEPSGIQTASNAKLDKKPSEGSSGSKTKKKPKGPSMGDHFSQKGKKASTKIGSEKQHNVDKSKEATQSKTVPRAPYKVYQELHELLTAPAPLEPDALLRGLAACFSKLAELNDFWGIVYLFDKFRGYAPPLDDLPSDGPVFDFLFKGANAKLRCGGISEAIEILEAIIANRPSMVNPRRLLASVVRYKDPGLALNYLRDIRHTQAFRSDRSAVLTYIDLLAENRLYGLARAEAMALQSEKHAGGLQLAMANLERLAADKLAFLNSFLGYEGLSPLSLKPNAVTMSLDDIDVAPLPPNSEGPLISILMTTFNSERYLRTAVGGIQAQTYRNWELWIVDDCSSDGTRNILRELQEADNRIHTIFKNDNSGTYVSKNLALKECRGEFVTCHDSDDFSHPERLARHVSHMVNNQKHLASLSRWVRIDNSGKFSLKSWGLYTHDNPASLTFRRQFVTENLGYFDSVRVGADTEFRQRLCARFGWDKVATINTVVTFGRHHEASLTQSGAGAIDEYGISPVRRIYSASWLDWHARNLENKDELFRPLEIGKRRFFAPSSITPNPIAAPPDPPTMGETQERFTFVSLPPQQLTSLPIEIPSDEVEVVHALDLSTDNFMASVMLNHAVIEHERGLSSAVWNVMQIKSDAYAWQAKRLTMSVRQPVLRQPPEAAKLMFIYGVQTLEKVAAAAASKPPAEQVMVLVRAKAEADDASAMLRKLGWHGSVRPLNYLLFGNRSSSGSVKLWDGALSPGLFDGKKRYTPDKVHALGISLCGFDVTDEDIAFIHRLSQKTKQRVTVLVEADDRAKLVGNNIDICVATRGRNFWNDFFAKASILVDRKSRPSSTTLFDSVGQALLRSRLAALLSSDPVPAPGTRVFEQEESLFDFLAGVSSDPAAFRTVLETASAEFRARLGDEFHVARLRRLLGTAERKTA